MGELDGTRIAFLDLPAFCAKIVEEFCEGEHEAQSRSVGAAS
jgi:hypothetical protein